MQNVRFIMRSMACFNVSCTDRNAVNTDGLKKREEEGGEGESGAFTPIFKNDRSAPRISKLERNERTCWPVSRSLAFFPRYHAPRVLFLSWRLTHRRLGKEMTLARDTVGFACLSVRSLRRS